MQLDLRAAHAAIVEHEEDFADVKGQEQPNGPSRSRWQAAIICS